MFRRTICSTNEPIVDGSLVDGPRLDGPKKPRGITNNYVVSKKSEIEIT